MRRRQRGVTRPQRVDRDGHRCKRAERRGDRQPVPDPAFTDSWYPAVTALPSDLRWRSRFQARFGFAPSDFADLYFDATNVLLAALRETARSSHGRLVIDRSGLAAAVRHTRRFPGVTCTITMDPATGFRIDDPGL